MAGSETLESSKAATIIGNYLFDKLISRSKPKDSPLVSPGPRRSLGLSALTHSTGARRDAIKKQSSSVKYFREGSRRKFTRPGLHKRHSEPNTSIQPVSSATSPGSDDDRFPIIRDGGGGGGGDGGRGRGRGGGGGGGGGRGGRGRSLRSRSVGFGRSSDDDDDDEDGSTIMNHLSNKVAHGFSKLVTAGERAFASNTSGAGGLNSSVGSTGSRGSSRDGSESSVGAVPANSEHGLDELLDAGETKDEHSKTGGAKVMSIPEGDEGDGREETSGEDDAGVGQGEGVDRDGDKGNAEDDVKKVPGTAAEVGGESTEDEDEPEEVLVRATLCPLLHEELMTIAFKLFDADTSGTVTREVRETVLACF